MGTLNVRVDNQSTPWMALTWTDDRGLKIRVEVASKEDEVVCADGLQAIRAAMGAVIGLEGAEEAIREVGVLVAQKLQEEGKA